MDKESIYSNKINKNNRNKRQIKNQKNIENETEEKFGSTTKNELITKDDDINLQNLPNTYKNLDILISNKLQSLGNNQENSQKSSNLIKKQNNFNSNNLIKQKINFHKKPVLDLIMSKTHTEKINETTNQSISLLLNKDIHNYKKVNSINHLNKMKNKSSNNLFNIKIAKSSRNIRKKTISKLSSNSESSSCLSKNFSFKKINHHVKFSHESSNKTIKNQNSLYFLKSDNHTNRSGFNDEKHSQNYQKYITKNKKDIKNALKKCLSSDNYNNHPNIFRTTKSLKTPKNLRNNTPQFKLYQKLHTSISSMTPDSKSNKSTDSIVKYESSFTPVNRKRARFRRKYQIKKKIELNFSNFMQEYNNNDKISNRKKKKSQTFLEANKIQKENLYTILLSNKPNKIKDANKIMDIITMDEVHKQIKETIGQYDKKELIKEIHDLETNDICEAIKKLPVMNNNPINNNSNYNNHEDNINDSDKTKYINNKKYEKIYNQSSKTKLMIFNDKYRKLIHKTLVYDSLDDEEMEEIEVYLFYIAPNSITVYLIDSIILISSLIQLLYLPIFLAHNLEFCRNIFSIQQLMFYLIDLFYILDLMTGFFRAYYNFDEFLVKNRNQTCKNYLKNRFFVDFIEAIPLYIIFNIMENKCKVNDIYFSNYYNININKLQYILLLIKAFKIFKVVSSSTILKKIKNKLNDYDFFFEYKTILFTIFVVFSSLNISSCIFIFLGRNSYPGWIIDRNIQNNSFRYIYLISIYYLITTVTTVGYGDILSISFKERIYQIIILIIGTCAYSWIITYVSNYIQKIQEKSIHFEKQISILKDIKLSSGNFSKELYDKIHRYLKYNRVDKKNNNEILIDCLPYPLKNTLFMEMYRDIIQNFKFFKSFENSNFIVKVVTSFKPVLSAKNDILVQEGDFIEDIIFVKEGILSIELCIDLNCIQESIESYLNERGFGKSKKLSKINNNFGSRLYSFKNTFNSTELKFNEISTNFNKEKETNEINIKYLRVLDIRKNEYYGDILMFLNERAPHRVKVKSKKAELFYLNKTDSIEISTLYPNIWKRIIQKSLFNMKQIRNLTRKILIYFSKLNGIALNEELCKDLNYSDSNISKPNFINDNQIVETTFRISKSRGNKDKNEVSNNINNRISSVIYEEENENIESTLTNSILNRDIKEINKRNSRNSNLNKKNVKINYNITKKSQKNISNNIKNNKDLKLKFNTDIKKTPKENNVESSNNFVSQKTEKLTICNNINSFSDYSEIKEYCFSISNINEINSEIYPNEKFNENKFLKNCSDSNENSIDIDKEKNEDKKLIVDYMDNNKINLNEVNEKKYEKDGHSLKNDIKQKQNFENLNIVNIINATISSIYDNLNQLSKYKFSRDINLRKKTIQFLMEESKISSNNSVVDSIIFPKIKIINPLYQYTKKRNSDTNSKNKLKSKNSNFDEEHPFMTSLGKDENSELKDIQSISQIERKLSKFSKRDCKYLSPELKKSTMSKRNYSLFRNSDFHRSMKDLYRNETERLPENIRNIYCKVKETMKNLVNTPEDQELNFYGKMKTLRASNNIVAASNSNNEIMKSSTKKSYLDLISHNIFEDRQTLNNPQEFYTGFFTNIVQNKINKRKKSCKIRKGANKRKSVEINKNRIKNNKYLLDSNDKEKIKNIKIEKKPSSASDVVKSTI